MKTIAEFMAAHHKHCDDEFAVAEEHSINGKWDSATTEFADFNKEMALHFRREEDILFPALAAVGGPAGPVQVMLMEHNQIRGLLAQMTAAVAEKNSKKYGGLSETLLMVMQQHNYKEENILYPIMDHMLSVEKESLMTRMQAS
jgi:DUF438 domain-containing protein